MSFLNLGLRKLFLPPSTHSKYNIDLFNCQEERGCEEQNWIEEVKGEEE